MCGWRNGVTLGDCDAAGLQVLDQLPRLVEVQTRLDRAVDTLHLQRLEWRQRRLVVETGLCRGKSGGGSEERINLV